MENQRPDGTRVAQSTFFKAFLQKAEKLLKHPIEVSKLIGDVLKKAASKKNIGELAVEVWENLQLLSRMIKAAMSGEYQGIPTPTLVGGIAVFIYFLSPIDFIPDFIPVVGLLDDAALLAWFMTSIKTELDRFAHWEATKPTPVRSSTVHDADSSFGTPKYSNQPAGTVTTASGQEAPHTHGVGSESTHTGSDEPTLRSATTDSSRSPKSSNDDLPTGGNIR
ncbi:YkvA family protein [Botryobacter ruber]|uniref:YkvA family protein n=1 Tax=Botryobacter ruber TaxID=2171629 RepID=UPI000E0B4C30|nr:YkvA family protein [Botryobacter ruber]